MEIVKVSLPEFSLLSAALKTVQRLQLRTLPLMIYEILPQFIELWGLNMATQVKSKKTSQN